jgi:threonine dehydratase
MRTEITIEDIRAAAERIQSIAQRTPVLTSRTFDARAGVQTFFKCENFQRGGAFKIRGASNFIFSIPVFDRGRGVVTFSSGNHAQAVAIAAYSDGITATIVMPADAPRSKVQATREYGATIIHYDRLRDDRESIGRRIADESGATLVPPFDHPWTIAGQGTAALELLDQAPGLDALVVCIGGGGLLSGSAIAARALHPDIRIFGVEPEDANDTYLSLQGGKRVTIPPPKTIADGLRSPAPGVITFPIIQKHVEDIVLVTDQEIRDTVKFLLERMKMLVEPSGAAAAAALLHHKLPQDLGRVGVILSGGNVDLEFLQTLET